MGEAGLGRFGAAVGIELERGVGDEPVGQEGEFFKLPEQLHEAVAIEVVQLFPPASEVLGFRR